jgi:hypothetical protein
MRHRARWTIAALVVVAGLGLAAWLVAKDGHASVHAEATEDDVPARVEPIEGSDFERVTLSQKAAERLGIETAAVRDEQVAGAARRVVPYAAILYGTTGETWVYTSPAPLVFVRQSVTVEHIDGDRAILADGPAAGTAVAVVGVSDLLGTELGVGGEED